MLHLHFTLPYLLPNEEECIEWTGSINGVATRLPLTPNAYRTEWHLHLSLTDENPTEELCYNYQVIDREATPLRIEPPQCPHTLRLKRAKGVTEGQCRIEDRWILAEPEHIYTRAPLAGLLGYQDLSSQRIPSVTVTPGELFLIPYALKYRGTLAVVGADPSIGAWDPEQAIPLTLSRNGYLLRFPKRIATEYKLLLRLPNGTLLWEEGANRRYQPEESGGLIFAHLDPPHFPSLQPITPPQITGTAVPLFALRGSHTQGIGDFTAASELLQWLSQQGQKVLQLLPIYDTTFTRTPQDSYPYSALSTYALHPIYLDICLLPGFHRAKERERWLQRAKELEDFASVQYTEVLRLKEEVLECLFEQWYRAKGYQQKHFSNFCKEDEEQLLPYALFCTLRDRHPGLSVSSYPPYAEVVEEWHRSRTYRGENIERAVLKHCYVQYHLYQQLELLRQEANRRGILIKGDLPIGVARNSVDVWEAPQLFHLDCKAGSPPDAFSATGQDWGFPTYNWEEMEQEGYRWWERRFRQMSRHFDALRIDHILGFFRIWSIPVGATSAAEGHYVPAMGYPQSEVRGVEEYCVRDSEGRYHPTLEPSQMEGYHRLSDEQKEQITALRNDYYYLRNEQLWRSNAIKRLSAIIRKSNLLLCAEDLGVLPKSIGEVLEMLELLSLEVIRMPKLMGRDFVHPEDLRPLSVLTTSTHDMASLRGWWQELSPQRQEEVAECYGTEETPATPQGLVEALNSQRFAPFLILPLQDWLVLGERTQDIDPEQEQINRPNDPHHVWDYRLPPDATPL